jgi:hypothetical protein
MIISPTNNEGWLYCYNDQMKEDEMDRECRIPETNEKFIKNYGLKT